MIHNDRAGMTQTTKFDLEGKVVLITGGGRGIGRAIALAFAEVGAAVAVTARTKSEIDSVIGEITERGGRPSPSPAMSSSAIK